MKAYINFQILKYLAYQFQIPFSYYGQSFSYTVILDLLNIVEDFCIYVYERYWSAVFL